MKLFRVVLLAALATGGCGDELGEGGAIQGTPSILEAPSNLSGTVTGIQVHLTWMDLAQGETQYRLDVSSTPSFTPPLLAVILLPANSTSYVYTGFRNTPYSFRALAVTAQYESDPSNTATVTTLNPPLPPAGFTATVISGSRVDLAWSDVANETSYRLERSQNGGVTWATLTTFPANTMAYGDSGLAADTEYSYRLFATNADGDSPPTATVSVLTLANISISRNATGSGDGRFTSIGLLPSGDEVISHYDDTNSNVLLTTVAFSTGAFGTSTVDSGPTGTQDVGGDGTSIVVDGAGKIHIAAHDVTSNTLRYITNAAGAFSATTIDAGPGPAGVLPRIAWSAMTGDLHLVYGVLPPGGSVMLRHAVKAGGGGWVKTDIPIAIQASHQHGLALSPAGVPQVSLADTGGLLRRAYPGSGGWTSEVIPVPVSSAFPDYTAIALDPSGAVHVVYHEYSSRGLYHATNATGSWASETIHQAAGQDQGTYCALAIDPSTGRLHVAYYDAINRDLRYARKDPGTSWSLKLLDATGDVGAHTGLILDGLGQIHVAYHDAANGDLKRAIGAP